MFSVTESVVPRSDSTRSLPESVTATSAWVMPAPNWSVLLPTAVSVRAPITS